ncbi:tRNA (guanosine(46)-N7)-methyltransferase TrmB [Hazenella sp. IB182357]|uniref:tRNA (guanine-N(7)-)-methyltransferase n=1 Tax=Polycladospora coralii TaxID=2771432 RepID=A0A926NCK2_9BACL|nr:tRNA (guanosine(46)-N7)-methyltransferase TrmB [Polycladospora coralii]MBD1370938.1 tRNA (guanosine(46)-N7)-methyltransferase TrmB [Polycladospora coralii]MBS7529877.1 tRNA (guanosine(46)-N7)-methyltransferase TrmB [Polycladospora coralii]
MRLRRNPHAKEILMNHPLVDVATNHHKGSWKSRFSNPHNPLNVELGTGKGQFLAKASSAYPEMNWIGIEKIEEPLVKAVLKGTETENENLRYLWMDILELTEVFAEGEVNRFYLHFSDPWPKARHAKRRLTAPSFLNQYKQLLHPDGDLILKTDSLSLYEYSLEMFTDNGFEFLASSRDLHHSIYASENITTEYEEKFASRGNPIYYVKVKPCK